MNGLTNGYLEIIIGPMFSGKTTRLIDIYKQYKLCNNQIIVLNHSIDERYDTVGMVTHDLNSIPCLKLSSLMCTTEILEWKDASVVLINEGQFFNDIIPFVKACLNAKKHVYVCGLDGDFERKKFGNILDLIPLCDKVTKLSSLCTQCKDGTKAIFSKRLSGEHEQTIVGHSNYAPVCRKCYETSTPFAC